MCGPRIRNGYTFVIEWRPNSLKVYMDTTQVFSTTTNVPEVPMVWVTQSGPGNFDLPAPTGSAHVQLDWVVAYDMA